jgi:hypothetical protein
MTLIESLGAACVLAGGAALVCYGRARGRAMSSSMPLASRPSHLDVGEHPVLDGRAVIRVTGTSALVDALQVKLGMPAEVFEPSVRPMIEAYAGFVQCLTAPSTKDVHPEPILQRALRAVHVALDRRRHQILPLGVAPEDIGALAHRWSYALMVVALIEVARETLRAVAVTFRSAVQPTPRHWEPAAGSLAAHDALAYRYGVATKDADGSAFLRFTLLHACVSPAVLAWLAEDERVFACLDAVLIGGSDPDAASLLALLSTPTASACGLTEPPTLHASTDGLVGERRRRGAPSASDATWVPAGVRVETDHGLDADTAAFLRWLRDALARGEIATNSAQAPVHGVQAGLLLVMPRIFTAYAKAQSADPVRTRTLSDTATRLRTIQKNLATIDGVPPKRIFDLHEGGTVVVQITGLLLPEPERFGIARPAVNPGLVQANSELL